MSGGTNDLGGNADGNGNGNGAVIYSRPEMVHLAIAMASLLFNNQLPWNVIAMLLGFAVAASSNEDISRLNAAVAVAVYSNGQIGQLNKAYDNYRRVIYRSLTFYFMIQVPIFTAIFSGQRRGSYQTWWTAIIVSGIASAAIIVALFLIFILQFNLRSRRGQIRQELRRQLGECGLSRVSITNRNNRKAIVADAREDDDEFDVKWVTPRAAFLLILITMALCFPISFTTLLCAHVP